MDRKTLLAVVLSVVIWIGWQKFYIEPRYGKPGAPIAVTNSTSGTTNPTSTNQEAVAKAVTTQAANIPLENKKLALKNAEVILTNGGQSLQSWNVDPYSQNLQTITHQDGQIELAFDQQEFAYINQAHCQWVSDTSCVYQDEKIKLTKNFKPLETARTLEMTVNVEFKQTKPNFLFVSLSNLSPADDIEPRDRQLTYYTQQKVEHQNVKDSKANVEVQTAVKWIGANSRYFLLAIVPQLAGNTTVGEPKGLFQPTLPNAGKMNLVFPINGKEITLPMKVYFGPKEIPSLKAVDPTLEQSVDFGFFTVIAYPILMALRWIYGVVHNYGVAIILLTILIKILTFPLTYKGMKSMKKMSVIQPQIQALKEKYGDDKEGFNREMLTLMKSGGYNPVAGCLPIFLQMPIFFALYRVLYSSIELYQAPFMFWIQDLSLKDHYFVTPILLTIVMFIQQKMTPPSPGMDPAQQKMLQWMPVMFGVFMVTLPSGLTLYMLTNTIVSILQQKMINSKLTT
jgi:YidC/Oxa1 family membrane protein insertase